MVSLGVLCAGAALRLETSMLHSLVRHAHFCLGSWQCSLCCVPFLQENLHKEQRIIMELFLKVVYQILSPVQAALFVVESFPYHCDVLALANILSILFGKEGGGGAAGLGNPTIGGGPGMAGTGQLSIGSNGAGAGHSGPTALPIAGLGLGAMGAPPNLAGNAAGGGGLASGETWPLMPSAEHATGTRA